MDKNDNKLVEMAKKAMLNSYSPYSNFKVGAAVLTESGNIYTGTNIENSSYSLTICAERVAIFKAVSSGERTFKKLAIVSSTGKPTYPCGACRQVIFEFSDNIEILLIHKDGIIKTNIKNLLPNGFKMKK